MEIVGLLVICWGLAVLAGMLRLTDGSLVSWFSEGLFALVGIGAPAAGLALVAAGAIVASRPASAAAALRPSPRVAGLLLLWLGCLMLADAATPAADGGAGGLLGWAVAAALRRVGGLYLAWMAGLATAVAGTHMALGLSWRETGRALLRLLARSGRGLRALLAAAVARVTAMARPRPAATAGWVDAARAGTGPAPTTADEETGAEPGSEEPEAEAVEEVTPAEEAPGEPAAKPALPLTMPPLSIFDPPSSFEGSNADDRLQAALIEETLSGFNIPAKVAEVQRGPAVTRFGVQLGYLDGPRGSLVRRKVRVSKIKTLADDLSLALAAAPIRIEAPIPGQPLVGIEVPNSAVSVVGIREVIDSDEYRGAKGVLRIALGRDIAGRPYVVPLERMPHVLVAGATGSGKSVCIAAIIASLLYGFAPERLRLLMIDPKRVELERYKGVPHLLGKPEVEVDGAVAALRYACKEMDRRYQVFARLGVRDLERYNARVAEGERLPYWVIVIDELADLMMTAPMDVEKAVCRLAQMARATGIHLVVATQRPSVDVVTGLIKANFPARISFAVTSQADSRVILDTTGAETLIGHGDMLYMSPESSRLVRLQGTYPTDEETRRLVAFWKEQTPVGQLVPVAPWSGMIEGEEDDELLEQAIAVAREAGTVSASYLQRRLRIGYPRAAALMDRLQDAGVIAPANGGGKMRVVRRAEDDGEGDDVADDDEAEEAS